MIWSTSKLDQKPTRACRNWRQFRISTLLVFMAAMSAWLAYGVDRVHREHRAVDALAQAGVYVTTASNAPDWAPDWLDRAWFRYVIAVNCHGDNGWRANTFEWNAEPTVPLPEKELYLLATGGVGQGDHHDGRLVTDDLARSIGAFKYCKVLYLANSQISDRGLQPLAALRYLQVLSLSGTRLTQGGVDELQRALPGCYIRWRRARHSVGDGVPR